jgi:uncharacterized surface protein with fasciclin (FAS1) repeats
MTDSPLPPPTEAMPVMSSPEESLLPKPWYKKPAGIGMLVAGAVLVAALIFGLVWASGDDDADVVAARVVLLPKDSAGAGLDRPFFGDVIGTSEFPSSFVFLEPGTFPGDGGIGGSSGGSGRMEFAWAPTSEVVKPEIWTSTITIVGSSPAGFTPPGPVVECVLARPDEQNTTVSMDVVVDPPDPLVEQEVTYTFTNHEFLPGDTVTCELVSLELPPETTTTVPETTVPETTIPETTVPETTVPETTVPETTVPETTVPETTVPETTVPETTVPETTTPETTVAPPAAPATAAEALQAAGNYATFLNLASAVPSVQALLDGTAPITVFAPNDAAFGGITPPADPAELEQLLLSHIVSGEALDAASLFDGSRTDVTMASGGTQPIVQDPATVGGATVVEADLASTNAWSHGIDTVFSTTP